jgi:hypothetical protein
MESAEVWVQVERSLLVRHFLQYLQLRTIKPSKSIE